jgi:hypothetical protein
MHDPLRADGMARETIHAGTAEGAGAATPKQGVAQQRLWPVAPQTTVDGFYHGQCRCEKQLTWLIFVTQPG